MIIHHALVLAVLALPKQYFAAHAVSPAFHSYSIATYHKPVFGCFALTRENNTEYFSFVKFLGYPYFFIPSLIII